MRHYCFDANLIELSNDELQISGGGAASSVLNFSTGAGLGATGVALVQGAKKGAQVGRLGGPWGIAAGAVVGGVVGVWLGSD